MTWSGANRPDAAAWRRLRAAVLKRDHGVCYVCGKPGADQVDHVIPYSLGGPSEEWNLRAVHRKPCHSTKSAKEGHAARRPSRRRPPELHPGILIPPAAQDPWGTTPLGPPR